MRLMCVKSIADTRCAMMRVTLERAFNGAQMRLMTRLWMIDCYADDGAPDISLPATPRHARFAPIRHVTDVY